jgi:hypothetical protein
MNEQIFKLAQQANLIGDWGEDITKGRYFVFDNLKSLENFAELIIRECAQLARDTELEDVEGGDSAVLRAAKLQILEHFGVEK